MGWGNDLWSRAEGHRVHEVVQTAGAAARAAAAYAGRSAIGRMQRRHAPPQGYVGDTDLFRLHEQRLLRLSLLL